MAGCAITAPTGMRRHTPSSNINSSVLKKSLHQLRWNFPYFLVGSVNA